MVPNDLSLNPTNITLFAIIKVNGFYQGTCHANQILGKGSPDNVQGYYTLRFTDSTHTCTGPPNTNIEIFYGEFGNNVPQGSDAGAATHDVVKTGQWYKLAFTYDGKESRIYVNGILADKRQRKVAFTANSQNLFIGKHEDPLYPYYFNGVIDEIRIYNHAICESGIKELSKK